MGFKRVSAAVSDTESTETAPEDKPRTEEKKAPQTAPGGAFGALMRRPALKYVGFALLLA